MSKQFILVDTFTQDGYYLTQGYGVNANLYSKYGLLCHEGIDLGHVDKIHAIRTPVDGIVIQDWDEPKGNYGDYVVIWDDEQKCAVWICHMSKNIVSYGQRVSAGEIIGYMGATGNVTGSHIHLNFVQTDDVGNRLYKAKSTNYGFLDPQHPLDPNPPKYPPGVQAYSVNWIIKNSQGGQVSDPNVYKGIDLNNKDSVKIAVDIWDAVVNEKSYIKVDDCKKQKEDSVEKARAEGNQNIKNFENELRQRLDLTTDAPREEIYNEINRLLEIENDSQDINDVKKDFQEERIRYAKTLNPNIDSQEVTSGTIITGITNLVEQSERVKELEQSLTECKENVIVPDKGISRYLGKPFLTWIASVIVTIIGMLSGTVDPTIGVGIIAGSGTVYNAGAALVKRKEIDAVSKGGEE